MTLSAADFEALPPQALEAQEAIADAPSLWKVLLADTRATLSMAVVLLIVLTAFVGPWLWPQDPATQWLSQVSSGPVGAQQALVVDDEATWSGPALAPQKLKVFQSTTTQVRLAWPEQPGASRYRIYRSAGEAALGIPLAEIDKTHYTDRLQLRPQSYRYAVIPVDAAGASLVASRGEARYRLEVAPTLSIGQFEAQLLGLNTEQNVVELPAHPLGTDSLGRDMLSRVIHGGRTSMLVGLTAPLLFIALGAFYGAAAGLLGGWVDNVLMRIADFVVALPFLLFMILFRVALGIESGESGLFPMVLAMVLLSWPASARLVRGQVLQLRGSAFVLSARLAGASNVYLIRRHLLPNVVPLLLVSLSFAIPQAIFTEALLSFIGMGVVPPTPSWGSLCNEGIRNMLTRPHELIVPAVAISIAVLSFNVLGDALRDAMDVQVRRSLR